MGGDSITVDGGEPTQDDLDTLIIKVNNMSSEGIYLFINLTMNLIFILL